MPCGKCQKCTSREKTNSLQELLRSDQSLLGAVAEWSLALIVRENKPKDPWFASWPRQFLFNFIYLKSLTSLESQRKIPIRMLGTTQLQVTQHKQVLKCK